MATTNTITIGILGLGRLGTSIGLALKRYNARKDAQQQFTITGFDSSSSTLRQAQDLGAIDAPARSADQCAEDKDIVVLTLPYSEVQPAYRAIGDSLRSGAVVLDFSPYALPSQGWAARHLRHEAHMVGVTAIINAKYLYDGLDDTEHAAADLFDQGALLITAGPQGDKDAVELASDLAFLLGASAQFADPLEHDVWASAMEGLPALVGVAAFQLLRHRQDWNDVQRAGGAAFGRLAHHVHDTHPDDLRDLFLSNRDQLVRQIDAMSESLSVLRDLLARNDQAALEQLLIESSDAYSDWINRRRDVRWDDRPKPPSMSPGAQLMTGMLGGALAKRLRGGSKGSR